MWWLAPLLVLLVIGLFLWFVSADARRLSRNLKSRRRKSKCVPWTKKSNGGPAGGFNFRRDTFRFADGRCWWDPVGELSIEADGANCRLSLVAIPYPGAADVAELPGRMWAPEADELMQQADTFAEGGLQIRERQIWLLDGRIKCVEFDPDQRVLSVRFRLMVRDGEDGDEEQVDGLAKCRVMTADQFAASSREGAPVEQSAQSDWREAHARLWRELVPASGQAETVQGEVIRCTGKLADEAYRNGNLNWESGYDRLARYVGETLNDSNTFSADERAKIAAAVDEIIGNYDTPPFSGHDSHYYLLSQMAVRWCLAKPVPIPREKDPGLEI